MAAELPKERIEIRYTPRGKDQKDDGVELPLKLLVVGNFQGNGSAETDTPLAEREASAIDQINFHKVMAAQNIAVDVSVANHLVGAQDKPQDLNLHLKFGSLADFHPDALIEQVPELRRTWVLRELLSELLQSPHKAEKIAAAIQEHLLPSSI